MEAIDQFVTRATPGCVETADANERRGSPPFRGMNGRVERPLIRLRLVKRAFWERATGSQTIFSINVVTQPRPGGAIVQIKFAVVVEGEDTDDSAAWRSWNEYRRIVSPFRCFYFYPCYCCCNYLSEHTFLWKFLLLHENAPIANSFSFFQEKQREDSLCHLDFLECATIQ